MYKILKKLIEMDDYSVQRLSSRVSQYLWYKLWGNTVQNGTPTPDSPIMPQGTGDRTGNLWDNLGFSANAFLSPGVHTTTNSYGTTLSTSTGGLVEITQIASGGNINYQNGFFFIEIDFSQFAVGDNFVISFDYEITNKLSTVNATVAYVGQQSTAINVIADWSKSGRAVIRATLTNAMTRPYVEVRLCGNSINVTNVQINRGSTALPYEPYGYKIPIVCDNKIKNIYLNEPLHKINDYADILSYSEQGVVRKIKKLVLTGEEAFFRDREREGSWRFYSNALISAKDNTAICSHFENIGTDGVNNSDNVGFCLFYKAQFGYRFPKSIASTVNEFKAWLAQQYANGTPVTVWYVLDTEETEQIKAPDILANKYTSITVDTEVQPSQTDFSTKGKKVEPTNVSSSVNTLNTMNINNEQITNDNLITNEENEEFEEI